MTFDVFVLTLVCEVAGTCIATYMIRNIDKKRKNDRHSIEHDR